jgi:hypothetical protein
MGAALTEEPTSYDVLYSLLLDASTIEEANDFEEWANGLGYDSDSPKAEKLYQTVQKQTKKLQVFLGPDFETFLRANPD